MLQKLNEKESYVPDITVFLQCTSPFTISEDIDSTIELLINNSADSAFAASTFKHFLWGKNSKGELIGINHNEKHSRERRQDIYTQYLEAGSVYVFLTKGFLKNENRFFGNISLYEIPQKRLFEIDTPSELKIANEIEKLLN